MYLSRIQIRNFRNFEDLDCSLSRNVLLLGENRVGKSNLLHALRLVLDMALPDSARQLKLTDFWDGCDLGKSPEIRINLDFADFDTDPSITELLTDYRLKADHTISRLTFLFRKKATITTPPSSNLDYEFLVFGAEDETRTVRTEVRRRISLDLLHALRDAEYELGRWNTSPLRPLLEDAIGQVPEQELKDITSKVAEATKKVGELAPVNALETALRTQILGLAGEAQDLRAKFGFVPLDHWRLVRSIGFFIDEGKRGIAEASLGSANLALLTIKLAEFAWRQSKNERNYTLLCIEEPEAHLHPQLQRQVFQKIFTDESAARSLFLSSHSPNIASIAPLKTIVLLKTSANKSTKAFSLANLQLPPNDLEDLERYMNATRAEILFSRGVLLVEGDAESILASIFATTEGHNFDELGITVCNVGGVHFSPYLSLVLHLKLPHAIITDWDPISPSKPPLGRERALKLINSVDQFNKKAALSPTKLAALNADDNLLRQEAARRNVFLNNSTFEIEISHTKGLLDPLISVLEGAGFGSVRRQRLKSWKSGTTPDPDQLMAMIADLGKGRLAGRLADKAAGLPVPQYFKEAINTLVSHVRKAS